MANSNHMVRLAAIAGARMHRVAQHIQQDYPDPTMVTQEEAQAHLAKSGHLYDENCNEPFCTKWRGMVNTAMAHVSQAH